MILIQVGAASEGVFGMGGAGAVSKVELGLAPA